MEKRLTPDKDLFLVSLGGDGIFRFWKQPPTEGSLAEKATAGWRADFREATIMSREEALELIGRLQNVVVGLVVQYPTTEAPTTGVTPDPSHGPAESACSGSFCEIAAIHDKGK